MVGCFVGSRGWGWRGCTVVPLRTVSSRCRLWGWWGPRVTAPGPACGTPWVAPSSHEVDSLVGNTGRGAMGANEEKNQFSMSNQESLKLMSYILSPVCHLPEMYLRSVDAVLSGAVLAGCLRSGRSSPTPVSSCCCSCLSDQVDHQDPVVGQARYRLSNFVNGHFAVPESHNRVLDRPALFLEAHHNFKPEVP